MAVNCSSSPIAITGFAGVTAMLLRLTEPSLSPIVITALASEIVPLIAALRLNVNVSAFSMSGQSRICTRTTLVVSRGAKLSVPEAVT